MTDPQGEPWVAEIEDFKLAVFWWLNVLNRLIREMSLGHVALISNIR